MGWEYLEPAWPTGQFCWACVEKLQAGIASLQLGRKRSPAPFLTGAKGQRGVRSAILPFAATVQVPGTEGRQRVTCWLCRLFPHSPSILGAWALRARHSRSILIWTTMNKTICIIEPRVRMLGKGPRFLGNLCRPYLDGEEWLPAAWTFY